MSNLNCEHGVLRVLCDICTPEMAQQLLAPTPKPAPAPEENMLPIPPQVKFGLCIFEMEDGSIRRVPVNPKNLKVSMGMVQRMLSSELVDLQAELIASKLKSMMKGG